MSESSTPGQKAGVTEPLLNKNADPNARAMPAYSSLDASTISDHSDLSQVGSLTEDLSDVSSYDYFPNKFNQNYRLAMLYYQTRRNRIHCVCCAILVLCIILVALVIGGGVSYYVVSHEKGCEDVKVYPVSCCNESHMLERHEGCGSSDNVLVPHVSCYGFNKKAQNMALYEAFCYFFKARYVMDFDDWYYVKETRHIAYDFNYLLNLSRQTFEDFFWSDLWNRIPNDKMYSYFKLELLKIMRVKRQLNFSTEAEKCYAWYNETRDINTEDKHCGLSATDN